MKIASTRMRKFMVVAGLMVPGLAAVMALSHGCRPGRDRSGGGDNGAIEIEAARLLEDRSQPWWNNHRPARTNEPVPYSIEPSDDLGARKDPPIYTSQMPLGLARWLLAGNRPRASHPLGGRPVVLLDVRRAGEFCAEHIQGSLNVPGWEVAKALETGGLSKLDRRTVVVVYGSRWPHYQVITQLKGSMGFEAVYAMEGMAAWKARGFSVVRDEKLVHFLKKLEGEGAPAAAAAPPQAAPESLAGVEPLALNVLMSAGIDLLCVFVGDRRSYESGHVPGAIHVPAGELSSRFASADKSRIVVVTCGCCQGKRGGPSEMAVRELGRLGFKRVLHLDGHMFAWKTAGLPVEFDDPHARK